MQGAMGGLSALASLGSGPSSLSPPAEEFNRRGANPS
jgi:hypothetical protein